ncbi:MAG: FAD-binding oxidoreductase [Burkholderiaceae bacterium]
MNLLLSPMHFGGITAALQAFASTCSTITVIDDEIQKVRESEGEIIAAGSEDSYRAAKVVIAAGSRSLGILSKDIVEKVCLPSIYFGKGVSTLVQSDEPILSTIRTPNRAFACGAHVVPRENGCIYLGATNFFGTDHVSEASIEVGELHILFDQAIHQINTELRRAKIIESKFGFRPIATSRTPLVGQTTNPNVFIGTGTYRNGVLMAPLIAKIISSALMGQESEHNNPYRPVFNTNVSTSPDIEKVVSSGIEDIVGILHEPNGILPYGRSEELSKFLSVIFRLALVDQDSSGVRQKMNAMLREIPLNETMNRIFYEVLSNGRAQTQDIGNVEGGK